MVHAKQLRSPGFSRIRRSQQDTAAPAGIHRLLNAEFSIPIIAAQESRLQPVNVHPPAAERRIFNPDHRRSGVPASAGSGVPSRIPLPRQASTGY